MPAGVGGNQPNDALTAARFSLRNPLNITDTHLVQSSLQQAGVSFAAAQQFSQGQAVTSAGDRMAIAKVVSELLRFLSK